MPKSQDTDPKAPNDGHPFKQAAKDDSPEAAKTARILKSNSCSYLSTHGRTRRERERRANGHTANFRLLMGLDNFRHRPPWRTPGYKAAVVAGGRYGAWCWSLIWIRCVRKT